MPFQIETIVKPSTIHGLGLFSKVAVKKGSLIWTYYKTKTSKPVQNLKDQAPNHQWFQEEMEKMDPQRIRSIFHGGSPHFQSNSYVQLKDGSNYINNSKDPNIKVYFSKQFDEEYTLAEKDIEPGDELTQNYEQEGSLDLPWVQQLMKKYCPLRYQQDKK